MLVSAKVVYLGAMRNEKGYFNLIIISTEYRL